MTLQVPETLLHRQRKMIFRGDLLAEGLRALGCPITFKATSTACWRGYVGTWAIESGRLFLVDLRGNLEDGSTVGVKEIFPGHPSKVFASWVNKDLECSIHFYPYGHLDYAVEEQVQLSIRKGMLTGEKTSSQVEDSRGLVRKFKDRFATPIQGVTHEQLFPPKARGAAAEQSGAKPIAAESNANSSEDRNSTSHRSIADFARELNVPPSALLEQLAAAGVRKQAAEESITEEDKRKLLEHLRKTHSANSDGRIKLQRKHSATSGNKSRTSHVSNQAMLLQSYLSASMPLVSPHMQSRAAIAGLQVFILGMADMLRQTESLSWDQFIANYEIALSEYGLLPSTPIEAFVQSVGSVAASSPEVEKIMKHGAQSIRMYVSEHDANSSADLVSAAIFAERNASSFAELAP